MNMNRNAPYSASLPMSDHQVLALREAERSSNKHTLRTRARIEEVQERLRRQREDDLAC